MLDQAATLNLFYLSMAALVTVEAFLVREAYEIGESLTNISTRLAASTFRLFTKGAVLYLFQYLYYYKAWFDWDWGWLNIPLCLIAIDFLEYWKHRLQHRSSLLWKTHLQHHAGKRFNMSLTIRSSVIDKAILQYCFFLWLPLLGFRPLDFFYAYVLWKFYQFYIHAAKLPDLKFLDRVLVMPSHHRLHHSILERHYDRNFSVCILLWDKMFGTYQAPEPVEEYGLREDHRTDSLLFSMFGPYGLARKLGTRPWIWEIPLLLVCAFVLGQFLGDEADNDVDATIFINLYVLAAVYGFALWQRLSTVKGGK